MDPFVSVTSEPGEHEPLAPAACLYRPIVFHEPHRRADPPSWVEHIPFAFWLVDVLRPGIFVELGTQSGNSYAAFAQAVTTLGLSTACYAIDTWQGDPQSGLYDEGVFTEWREYHDARFSAFSRLIRSSFSEAAAHFADGSIDLLHIDGCHTFEAVERDFATWLPKMSRRGIVLLHDINVREGDFGAWRLWQQLERAYPSFAFLHGHGLGVLGVGRDYPEPLRWLLSRAPADTQTVTEIRRFFSRLGGHLTRGHEERARYERMQQELQSRLQIERDQREQAAGDLELRRQSSRACLDYAVRALETRVHEERERRDEAVREVERRLAEERAHRDQAIRELDAEARALAALLDASRAREHARQTWMERGRARVARRFAAIRESRIGRAGAALRGVARVGRLSVTSGPWPVRARALARFAASPRRLREADVIARSGLFDAEYYQTQYPDVTASATHPLVHYVLWGAFEGRRPHPLFEPAYYLERNPDVGRARLEPLTHFLLHGAFESRNPGPHFDCSYYLACNPDVRASGQNPLVDFLTDGWRKGRNPFPSFDCAGYIERYQDVVSSGMNPLVHYAEIGCLEDRDTSSLADAPLAVEPRIRLVSQPLHEPGPSPPLIVCLTHVSPWPPHAGNAYRVYRLLLRLQHDGFRIVPVIAPLPGEMPNDEAIRKVVELFSNVVLIDRTGQIRHSLQDVPDVLSALQGEHTPRFSAMLGEEDPLSQRERELLTIERRYCHDAAIATVLRLHAVLPRYVLLSEYVWMTRLLPLLDDRAIKVIDTHDVYSDKAAKVLKFGVPDLWLSEEEEARRLGLADLVVAIQDDERMALQRLVPEARVVTAGIDFEVVESAGLPEAKRVLYVGSGNAMNVRGLQEFLRFAWPSIREQVPDAELMIAGAVSEHVRGDPPGVRALGRVDDLDELYRSARVVVNPAHAGTGLKIKTVEALCHLRPIVTWPTGVDGLPGELKVLCDVVQDWYEFAPRVVSRLVADRRETFSAAQRQLIAQSTSWDTVYVKLSSALRELWERRGVRTSSSI